MLLFICRDTTGSEKNLGTLLNNNVPLLFFVNRARADNEQKNPKIFEIFAQNKIKMTGPVKYIKKFVAIVSTSVDVIIIQN